MEEEDLDMIQTAVLVVVVAELAEEAVREQQREAEAAAPRKEQVHLPVHQIH